MTHTKSSFAVAVRDRGELFVFWSIVRSVQGDVYVNFPRDEGEPHASYHASGQHHQKRSGNKMLVQQKQKPDANFRGTENVVTTGIAPDEPRAVDEQCDPHKFLDVFEIPVEELRLEKYRTLLSVDLVDTHSTPCITPGATIKRQHVFQNAFPWIMVTLVETSCGVALVALSPQSVEF